MIDYEALFKISYGLYIVNSGDKKKGNGFISNTVFQVTSEPAKFAACCNKDNYTGEFIEKYGCFSVSVLHQNTDPKIFGRFGYKSGKQINKLEGMDIKYGSTSCPIVLDDCLAYLECKLVDTFDVGTHWIFIGELLDAQILDDSLEPITYDYYQKVKKGKAPKNAPTYLDTSKLNNMEKQTSAKYKCSVCGYIYDDAREDIPFEDLPDDWKCPECGSDKEVFNKI